MGDTRPSVENFPADYPSTGTLTVSEDRPLDDGSHLITLNMGAAAPADARRVAGDPQARR
ncbi:MAG: hypothetical protein R2845_03955 [Thermomicrobiales bacterium]